MFRSPVFQPHDLHFDQKIVASSVRLMGELLLIEILNVNQKITKRNIFRMMTALDT